MKSLFGIYICVLFVLICTSCEKYESLNKEFHDVYGTWELIKASGGTIGLINPSFDQLTIVRSNENKVNQGMSKFADYQSHFKGELVAHGEIFIINQYTDVIWISFTNDPFPGSGKIAIESLGTNEMFLNISYPTYSLYTYSFIKVSNPSNDSFGIHQKSY